jgi:hypothetical protein
MTGSVDTFWLESWKSIARFPLFLTFPDRSFEFLWQGNWMFNGKIRISGKRIILPGKRNIKGHEDAVLHQKKFFQKKRRHHRSFNSGNKRGNACAPGPLGED